MATKFPKFSQVLHKIQPPVESGMVSRRRTTLKVMTASRKKIYIKKSSPPILGNWQSSSSGRRVIYSTLPGRQLSTMGTRPSSCSSHCTCDLGSSLRAARRRSIYAWWCTGACQHCDFRRLPMVVYDRSPKQSRPLPWINLSNFAGGCISVRWLAPPAARLSTRLGVV
jgi:hypothetical protein